MSMNISNYSDRLYVPNQNHQNYSNKNSGISADQIEMRRFIAKGQDALDGLADGPATMSSIQEEMKNNNGNPAKQRVSSEWERIWSRVNGNMNEWRKVLLNGVSMMKAEDAAMTSEREAGITNGSNDYNNGNHDHGGGNHGPSGYGNQNNNWGSSNHNQNNNWGQSNHNQNNNWGSHGGNGHGNNNGNNNYGNNNNYGGHGGHGGRGNGYGCDDNGRQDYGQGNRKHHGQQYGFQSGFQSGYRSGYEDGYEDANSDNDSCRMHPHKAQSYGSSSHHSHLSDMFRAPGSMIPFLQPR